MPIGVPKVALHFPGDPSEQWMDLYNRLYMERILFLCEEIDEELANQLIGIMLYLNTEEQSKGCFIYINSPGGSVTSGMGLYDTMTYVKGDITTICVGTAASMASFILASGTLGKRIAFSNSCIMIHQPEGGGFGQVSEVLYESQEILRIRRQVGKIYAERTGQSIAQISRDMDRDQFMSAREAKDYGIVDQVAVETKWSLSSSRK
jgi:ATP-dependent Clp protease protease subunit